MTNVLQAPMNPARVPPIAPVAPVVPRAPGAPAGPALPGVTSPTLAPRVRTSRLRTRHMVLMVSFVLMVMIPSALSAWYLWFKAADQYASTVSFSVRQEQSSSAISLLGALPSLSGSSSADTDIIYDYINSQQLVAEIEAELKVSQIWSQPEGDLIYAYDPSGTIEDLTDYWRDMVKVYYDSVTRLIEVRVLAFSPEEAQVITRLIFDKSTELVNKLNAISRADAVRYATEELKETEGRLREARQAMTTFRARNQIIDPTSAVTGQSMVLQQLQQELVKTQIELGLLSGTGLSDDPRRPVMEKRIAVIEQQMELERKKLGVGENGEPGSAMVSIVSEYERLFVDLEFAEGAYRAARAAYDVAQAESRRRTRYLAAHVVPTMAESSRFPERGVTWAVLSVFLLLTWSILSLVYYAVRDRR